MITEKDIRINNRFQTKNGSVVVVTFENIHNCLKSLHLFEGILLTGEFLEKQGVLRDSSFKNVYRVGRLEFIEREGLFRVMFDKVCLKEIRFVHEAQEALYFAISKILK